MRVPNFGTRVDALQRQMIDVKFVVLIAYWARTMSRIFVQLRKQPGSLPIALRPKLEYHPVRSDDFF